MHTRGRAPGRTAPAASLPPRGAGSARGVVELVAATLLWGATFVVIRDSVRHVDPVALVFARFVVAAPVLIAIAVATRRPFTRAAWIGGGLGGAIAAFAFALQAAGLRHTSAGTSAFLTALGSLFAGLFAWPLLRQRPSAALAAGMAIAAVGAALLTGVHVLAFGWGERVTIVGAAAFGLQVVVLSRFAPAADPLALAAVQAAALALVAASFGAARVDAALFASPLAVRFGYLVIAGSIVAPLLQVRAQRTLNAGRTGLLLGLEPVFAAAFASTLGAEHPPATWWAGALLILIAVWIVESRAAPPAR
jgi:drug/metabolite transporter (DMT)-like permease